MTLRPKEAFSAEQLGIRSNLPAATSINKATGGGNTSAKLME